MTQGPLLCYNGLKDKEERMNDLINVIAGAAIWNLALVTPFVLPVLGEAIVNWFDRRNRR